MIFYETTNFYFILPSKTCQRHFETKAANVWDLLKNCKRMETPSEIRTKS